MGSRKQPGTKGAAAGWIGPGVLATVLVVCGIVSWCVQLPAPVPSAAAPPHVFSEERATKHVAAILDLGLPRTVGSVVNEVHTPNYLSSQINALAAEAAAAGHVSVELSIQRPTGTFELDFLDGMWSAYTNVTNILVRVAPLRKPAEGAVLLSAHYDAALGSPGASDDLAAVGVLMEVLRNVVHSPPLQHALIFNLNGAEENILQASHGFISQHAWRKEVKAFINIEACGAGGREIVFQTGPGHPWLVELYAKVVPHPHISVIAQEIFQSNVIPSDTDYRIYRDFGAVPGFDMAWFENGYVYHTRHDDLDNLEPGAIQHTGENVLALVQALGSAPQLLTGGYEPDVSLIFFDILGKVTLLWSSSTQMFTCASVAMLLSWLLRTGRLDRQQPTPKGVRGANVMGTSPKKLWSSLKLYVVSNLITILAPVLVGLLLPVLRLKMAWYSRPYLIVGLFVAPAVASIVWATVWTWDKTVAPAQAEHDALLARICGWTFTMVVASLFKLGFATVALWWVVFALLAKLLELHLTPPAVAAGPTKSVVALALRLAVGEIPPLLLSTWCCAYAVFAMFVPLMGRIGIAAPADAIVGLLVGLFTVLLGSTASSLAIGLTPGGKSAVFKCCSLLWATALAACIYNPEPFSVDPPRGKRLYLQHAIRKVHSLTGTIQTDSGLWINALDPTGIEPVRHMPELEGMIEASREGVYGGFPWVLPLAGLVPQSWYVKDPVTYVIKVEGEDDAARADAAAAAAAAAAPPPPPSIACPAGACAELRFEGVAELSASGVEAGRRRRQFNFTAFGPDHLGLYIQPCLKGGQTKVTRWNFGSPPTVNKADHIFVYISSGHEAQEWPVHLEIEEDEVMHSECASSIGVALAGQHFTLSSRVLDNVVAALPPAVIPFPWVSSYESYLF